MYVANLKKFYKSFWVCVFFINKIKWCLEEVMFCHKNKSTKSKKFSLSLVPYWKSLSSHSRLLEYLLVSLVFAHSLNWVSLYKIEKLMKLQTRKTSEELWSVSYVLFILCEIIQHMHIHINHTHIWHFIIEVSSVDPRCF